jgi:hypothetical protein
MKTSGYYFLVVCALLSRLSVAQKDETRRLEPFTRIDISDKVLVQLVKAEEESLEIKIQRAEASVVVADVTDNTLKIRVEVPPLDYGKVNIILKYRNIDEIKVADMAEVSSVSLIKTDSLRVILKGGGKAYLDLDLAYLDSRILEGGVLSAEGHAVSQNAFVATSGALSAFNLESDIVKVKAATGGIAKVHAGKSIVADAQTGGYISYRGDPGDKILNSGTGGKIVKSD